MASINLTNKQLRLIQTALDLYSRVGILQFDRLLEHPTIDDLIISQITPDKEFEIGDHTMRGEIVEIGDDFIKTKGRWGNGEEIKTWTDIDKIKHSPDWSKLHDKRNFIRYQLNKLKNEINGDNTVNFGDGSNLGIHNKNVDESCREAFDIIQVIRHEFWKESENKSNITVDSSISLTTSKSPVEVKLDTIKEIRKEKIKKIGK